jgi:predicted oxidoreductase
MKLGLLAFAAAALPAVRAQATTVPRCRLGGSNVDVSCVALGTLHIHELPTTQAAVDYLTAALAIGVTTIDTSDVYRDAIPILGQAFASQPGLRERFEVVAKMDITGAWPSGFGFDSGSVYDSSAAHLSAVLQTYLTSFNTTYVDVLMLHHQDFLLNLTEVSGLVKGWIAAGTVRAFGVSNFDVQTFGALAAAMAPYPLVANEIELSVLQPAAFVDGRVSYHYGQGSTILAWGPLGGE